MEDIEGFCITEDMENWFKGRGYDFDLEKPTLKWLTYAKKRQAGQTKDKPYKDLVAAWKNAMKREAEEHARGNRNSQRSVPKSIEWDSRVIDRAREIRRQRRSTG